MALKKPTIVWSKPKKIAIADLSEWPKNPRQITKKEYADMKKSIEKYGNADEIHVNTDMMTITGHQRVKLYHAEGETHIMAKFPQRKMTDKEIDEFGLAHNKSGGHWDWDHMANMFDFDDLIRDHGFSHQELLGHHKGEKDKPTNNPIPNMDLFPDEHHDYIVVLFDNYQDFMFAVQKLEIKKVNATRSDKNRKVGIGRIIKGSELVERLK